MTSTTSLKDLIAQREALESQIRAAQSTERNAAIEQIKSLMADYGLTEADLNDGGRKGKKAGGSKSTVAAKYKDPETGATWSGRGLKPKWLTEKINGGKKLEDFAI